MPEFFHVDRIRGRLNEGQVISFIFDQSSITDSNNRAANFISMFPEGVTCHGWEYLLKDRRISPDKDKNGMIEMLAEYIRRSHYPDRLSRFQSFFACRTIQDAERFISLSPITTPEGQVRHQGDIWVVQCENVALEADMKFLGLGDSWIDAITKLHLYWAGEIGEDPLKELLLKPPITVVKKVKRL